MARPLSASTSSALLAGVLLGGGLTVGAAGASIAGEGAGTALQEPSPLATSTELARRTQTPITFDRLQRYRAERGVSIDETPVELAEELFDVYLPRKAPADGRHGLLVWISPHELMPAPNAWRGALDEHGMILASARRSGNQHGTLTRRMPLALHAAHALMQEHDIDPDRVYVGGFSGGARAALRLAVGFPEVFRGAILNAGSDPMGSDAMSPPPAEQLALLQERGRLVWVTGVRDLPNRRMEQESRDSMHAHCVGDLHSVSMSRTEHAPPDRRNFAKALDLLDPLDGHATAAADRAPALRVCRAALAASVDAALSEVDALIAAGDIAGAGERLGAIDLRWGGLAAPRSVELARQLAALRNGN